MEERVTHNNLFFILFSELDHLFCHELSSYGYPQFLNWEDVLNVDKGYVKDDAITVEVIVTDFIIWITENSFLNILFELVTLFFH